MIRLHRHTAVIILAVACLIGMTGVPPAAAGYIDSINPNATPAPNTSIGGSLTGFGWYYTPTQSYSLTGIASYFEPINFGTGSRTITVQIQTAPPVDGGSVIAQGTVVADSNVGGVVGAGFAPVALTAGTTYFVDFLNLFGMGIDEGQWADVNGVHVATAGATTRLSDFFVDSGSDTSFSSDRMGDAADEALATGNVSGLEPILFFSGSPAVVPEPSSALLLALGLGAVAVYRRRRAA